MSNPFIVKKTVFDNELPTEGQHLAVLADMDFQAGVQSEFGLQDQYYFYWLVDQVGTKPENKGQHLEIRQMLNVSMGEKSNLRKTIRGMLGFDPGDGGDGYDVQALIGTSAYIIIEHRTSKEGRIYAKVGMTLKAPTGAKLAIPTGYTRRQDRPKGRTATGFAKPHAAGLTSNPNPSNLNPGDLSGI